MLVEPPIIIHKPESELSTILHEILFDLCSGQLLNEKIDEVFFALLKILPIPVKRPTQPNFLSLYIDPHPSLTSQKAIDSLSQLHIQLFRYIDT